MLSEFIGIRVNCAISVEDMMNVTFVILQTIMLLIFSWKIPFGMIIKGCIAKFAYSPPNIRKISKKYIPPGVEKMFGKRASKKILIFSTVLCSTMKKNEHGSSFLFMHIEDKFLIITWEGITLFRISSQDGRQS